MPSRLGCLGQSGGGGGEATVPETKYVHPLPGPILHSMIPMPFNLLYAMLLLHSDSLCLFHKQTRLSAGHVPFGVLKDSGNDNRALNPSYEDSRLLPKPVVPHLPSCFPFRVLCTSPASVLTPNLAHILSGPLLYAEQKHHITLFKQMYYI